MVLGLDFFFCRDQYPKEGKNCVLDNGGSIVRHNNSI